MGRRLIRLCLVLATVAVLGAGVELESGKAYIFKRRIGPPITGTVTELTATDVRVLLEEGIALIIARDDIVEATPTTSARQEYEDKKKDAKTADEWYQLGLWAKDKKLERSATEAFREVIKLDEEHEGARKELGFVKYEGKWLPEDEARRKMGWKRLGEKWYSPEEYKKAVGEREQRLAEGRQKEMADIVEEFVIGRPWAEVAPIQTKYYQVKCNSTDVVAAEYATLMDRIFETYTGVFPESEFPRQDRGEAKVFIWKNQEEFRDITFAPPGVGGFFNWDSNMICAFHGGFGQTGSTYEVLAHEGTHQFQHRIMKSMRASPTWVLEGMAVYFGEGAKVEAQKIELHQLPRDRVSALKQMMEDDTYVPVKRVIRTPHAAFGGDCYATAWAMFYWCLRGKEHKPALHDGEGVELLDGYVKHCAAQEKEKDIPPVGGPRLEEEAKYFEGMVQEKLKRTVDEWNEDIKTFVLALKLDPLGKWRGDAWESTALKMKAERPSGMRTVPEKNLRKNEVVALEAMFGGARIGVFETPNFMRIRPTPQIASQFIRGTIEVAESVAEPEAKLIGGYEAVEGIVRGYRLPETERTVGRAQGEADAKGAPKAPSRADKGPLRQIRVILLATPDHIYTVVCEAEPERFLRDDDKYFRTFLESLRLG
ncbi:MAG: DUF1570 domain-containing protein [Planctomycetes bacterium]|nr:DUF1570 domain-containing protein [Planctomycetota bacterium]